MGLDSFPSCKLVMLALKGQTIPNQLIFWNPEVEKEILEGIFILSTLNFFFFFFTLHSPIFSSFFFSFLFFFLWKSVASSWSFTVCYDVCGSMPAGYTAWLAVRQDWGLFQIAGNYKYLQNRDRQPCCQLSVWQNAILGYMYSREWIKQMWVVFVCLCWFFLSQLSWRIRVLTAYIGFKRDTHYGSCFTLQQIQDLCSDLHKTKVIILIYVLRTK